MANFLDYLNALEAPQPVDVPTLPHASMAAALREQPDIRRAAVPALPDPSGMVPEPAPRATAAGVHGSNVAGFLRGLGDILARSGFQYSNGRGFAVGKRPSGDPSAVDRTNDVLKSSAATLAKRRWEKAAESLEKARKQVKARPASPRAKASEAEETETLPAWVVSAMGADAPEGGVVPSNRASQYYTEARRRATASGKPKKGAAAAKPVKPHPALLADWNAAKRAVLSGEADEGADQDAAAAMIEDMLDRAASDADLRLIAGYIKSAGVADRVRALFDEAEKRIAAR